MFPCSGLAEIVRSDSFLSNVHLVVCGGPAWLLEGHFSLLHATLIRPTHRFGLFYSCFREGNYSLDIEIVLRAQVKSLYRIHVLSASQ